MTQLIPYPRALSRAVGALSLCALAACLKPENTSGMLYSSNVLPADAEIPRLEDDPGAAMKLDLNDGFGMTIPLHSGFVAGSEVQYWDFGTVAALAAKPMWIFRRQGQDSAQDIGHPNLIDSIPGDTPYTPLRQIYTVYVTPFYNGERITTLRALDDAIDQGIVMSPQPRPNFINCAVAVSSTQMEAGDGGDPIKPEATYYRGKIVYQFCPGGFVDGVGAFALKDGNVTAGNAYLVRRTNDGQPLDEMLFKQDFNSDGDMVDTNTIFDSNVRDPSYVSIWHSIDVAVPDSYMFGDAKAESDLFTKQSGQLIGKPGEVLSYKDNGVFLDRPILPVTP